MSGKYNRTAVVNAENRYLKQQLEGAHKLLLKAYKKLDIVEHSDVVFEIGMYMKTVPEIASYIDGQVASDMEELEEKSK